MGLHSDLQAACRAPDAPVKVIDFSLAVFFRQPAEPCGTPEFMAPELITNPDEIAKTGASPQQTLSSTQLPHAVWSVQSHDHAVAVCKPA